METLRGCLLGTFTAVCAFSMVGCSDSNGQGEQEISGIATSVVTKTPQEDRAFVVVDLAKSDDPDTEVDETVVASGVSGPLGVFTAKLGLDVNNVFIAFPATDGDPRTSGLFSLVEANAAEKTLEDFTDIACVAGAQIVGEGVVQASLMNAERIDNLEAGAKEVLATQSVDFNDTESFNAAVQRTRELTADGDNPPSMQ